MRNEPAPAAEATAGTLLRQARQRAGLSLGALAVTMKLPEARLQALEADNYDFFSDHVLMRALAQSLCRTLRADPAPVLALLPRPESKNLLARGPDAVGTPFKAEFLHGTGMPPQRRWYWGAAIAALLAAAALLYFWPLPGDGNPPGTSTQVVVEEKTQPLPASVRAAPPPIGPQPASAPPAAPEAAAPPAVLDAAPQPAAQAPQSNTAPAPPPDAATPGATTPDNATTTAAPALLRIQASARAWVQVKNAEGRTLLEKNLAADETANIRDDALPLSVVIGNATAVQVHVRGQALDLSAHQSVARFAVQ